MRPAFPALLAVLAVDVGEGPLLGLPLHPVAPAGHQAVHDVQRVVGDAFQHEPPVRAVQEAGRFCVSVLLLQSLSVSGIQTSTSNIWSLVFSKSEFTFK